MTPAADSYGSAEGVAAFSGTWTNDGEFLDATVYVAASNPTLTTVETWIDEVSAMLNTALGNYGFETPLTSSKSLLVAGAIVNRLVSDLVDFARSKGRFLSSGFEKSGMSIFQALMNDLDAWVLVYAPGIEANGDPRTGAGVRIGFRSHDEAGEAITPIFQRKEFGNVIRDWDKNE